MKSKYDIFFSYAHRDGGVAKHLASSLERAGLTCFLAEKDIAAGEQWQNRIREAIHESERMVLLITPRSRNSLWVMAEAGAAWALNKPLIAALMFVEASELIEPIRSYQARLVESPDQTETLINELAGAKRMVASNTSVISGQWIDHTDGDVVFFRQVDNRVVGFYDYGSGDRIVGVYTGTFNVQEGVLNYRWRWLSGQFEGYGRMNLSGDSKRLSGDWWYGDNSSKTEHAMYHRISDAMPSWLKEGDFKKYEAFLAGKAEA